MDSNLAASQGPGIEPNDITLWLLELSARSISMGIAWEAKPNLVLNVGIGATDYFSETTRADHQYYPSVQYNKDVVFMELGVQYKFY